MEQFKALCGLWRDPTKSQGRHKGVGSLALLPSRGPQCPLWVTGKVDTKVLVSQAIDNKAPSITTFPRGNSRRVSVSWYNCHHTQPADSLPRRPCSTAGPSSPASACHTEIGLYLGQKNWINKTGRDEDFYHESISTNSVHSPGIKQRGWGLSKLVTC